MSHDVRAQLLSHVRPFATPWARARQAPLSMGFSRREYWSMLPCPPPRDLPDPGVKLRSLTLRVDSLLSEPPGKTHVSWSTVPSPVRGTTNPIHLFQSLGNPRSHNRPLTPVESLRGSHMSFCRTRGVMPRAVQSLCRGWASAGTQSPGEKTDRNPDFS